MAEVHCETRSDPGEVPPDRARFAPAGQTDSCPDHGEASRQRSGRLPGHRVVTMSGDLCEKAGCERLFRVGPVLDLTPEPFDWTLGADLYVMFRITGAALPRFQPAELAAAPVTPAPQAPDHATGPVCGVHSGNARPPVQSSGFSPGQRSHGKARAPGGGAAGPPFPALPTDVPDTTPNTKRSTP